MNITIGENERVYFQVSGTHSIFLTGNYVEAQFEGTDDLMRTMTRVRLTASTAAGTAGALA